MFFETKCFTGLLVWYGNIMPWQQENCVITQLYESILHSYSAYMVFVTMHIADQCGYNENTITMARNELYNNKAI